MSHIDFIAMPKPRTAHSRAPLPAMATYAAGKAFVLHFSEALSHELAGSGVQVMAACPGPTATQFFSGVTTNMSLSLRHPATTYGFVHRDE